MLAVRQRFGTHALFLVAPNYLLELKVRIKDDTEYQRYDKMVLDAPLLVLDDLGEGQKTKEGSLSEWARERLFHLINYRYEKELPLIVTSKYGPDQLPSVIGEASASRLAEMCWFLHTKDGDYRKRNLLIIE